LRGDRNVNKKVLGFSLTKAIPQALAYMLASPNPDRSLVKAVLNGSEFSFIKLISADVSQYALSDALSLLNRRNDLYPALRILKRFATLMAIAL
jgi:hypothetical protein